MPQKPIFIAGTKHAETNINLAKHLKGASAGYTLPRNPQNYFIINYGRFDNYGNLNKRLIFNKLEALKILERKGVSTPKIIITRHPENISNYEYPLLARKEHHARGSDAIFLKNRKCLLKRLRKVRRRDFFIRYIEKEKEFRVHILGNEVANISQKIKDDDETTHHPHIWSLARGWVCVDYNGRYNRPLSELGKQAVKAIGYDFGAVDIILGKDGKFYVLEINSAPRLCIERRRKYTKYFRDKEIQHRRR